LKPVKGIELVKASGAKNQQMPMGLVAMTLPIHSNLARLARAVNKSLIKKSLITI
jgi:hypothetical protein